MTAVDWIILLVILLYTLNGFHRGFIGTIFNLFGSLAALIAALAAPATSCVQVGAKIAPYLKESVSCHHPTLFDLRVHICFRAVESVFPAICRTFYRLSTSR